MKEPFAYVLYVEHNDDEHTYSVSVHQTLDEAEAALRAYAATIFVGVNDAEIVEGLAELGEHVRLFACTAKRNAQFSIQLAPFADGKAAAA